MPSGVAMRQPNWRANSMEAAAPGMFQPGFGMPKAPKGRLEGRPGRIGILTLGRYTPLLTEVRNTDLMKRASP